MFGRSKVPRQSVSTRTRSKKDPVTADIPILFGIMFGLAIAELIFTIDSFQWLQKNRKWYSNTERARLAFLIFSCVRAIMLSAVYIGIHCAQKLFHNMAHTVFVVISTILWVVSGVLIHQMWGYIECANEGVAESVAEFRSQIMDGLTECHEVKIIEILAWTLAAVSVVATVPVVITANRRRARRNEGKAAMSG